MSATRLKFVAEVVAGQSPPLEHVSDLQDGLPFLQGNAEFREINPRARLECSRAPKLAKKGDLLLSVRAPVGALNVADQDYGIGRGLNAIRARSIHPEYLYWLLVDSRPYLDSVSTGSTFAAVTAANVGSIGVPLTSTIEQREIADYLDAQTSKIDALIGKQAQLIDTLTERRQVVVTETIESQVSPAHVSLPGQQSHRIKYLYTVIDDRAGAQDLPLLSVSIHRGVQRRDETTGDDPRSDDLSVYKVCEVGDVIVNRMRAFQGAVGLALERGLTSPDYLVLRPRDSVDARWLTTLMRSRWFVSEMTARLRGIGSTDIGTVRTPRINASDLGEIRIRVPSLLEQRATAAHLDRETSQIVTLAAKAREMIDVLKERRLALISAAVTGKIDVRGLA